MSRAVTTGQGWLSRRSRCENSNRVVGAGLALGLIVSAKFGI